MRDFMNIILREFDFYNVENPYETKDDYDKDDYDKDGDDKWDDDNKWDNDPIKEMRFIHIDYIIDSSGSMGPYSSLVNQGFQNFVESQRADNSVGTMSLTVFDNNIDNVFDFVDIKHVNTGYRNLGGGTALYDAIVTRIKHVADKWQFTGGEVVIIVVTDGEDNMSSHTAENVCALITHYRKLGWKFLFYGPTRTGQISGKQMCFNPDEIQTFDNNKVDKTFKDAALKIKDIKR